MARIMSTLSELPRKLGSFLIFRGQEAIGIILMAAGLSLALILFSYHASDPIIILLSLLLLLLLLLLLHYYYYYILLLLSLLLHPFTATSSAITGSRAR